MLINSLFSRLYAWVFSFNSQLCRFMCGERVFESLLTDGRWCPSCVRVASCWIGVRNSRACVRAIANQ
ncbi:hypothetical protein M6B38_188155 [Iris pallida]|uniref:Secreted protein n=1 Tax=Iris pallida TaxID=29817 RepID=A0AAX6EHK4_IRIPA|nr:hypothetical protein M6B38_188155 [Iris pallida]